MEQGRRARGAFSFAPHKVRGLRQMAKLLGGRASITDQEALLFHSRGRPGKLEIVATKPMATQRDLSLAYSPGVAVPGEGDRRRSLDGLRLHRARQHGRRHHQRHRDPRPRQSRRARLQAGDGGQGGAVQALRRRRFDRPRGRHRGPRRIHQRRQISRPLLRRHQPRGHQGAGVLHHRGAPARVDGHSGLPRRPARHRDHRRRRHDQRDAADRPRHQEDAAGLQRRGRRRHRLPRSDQGDGLRARERHPLRHQGRRLSRPHARA